MTSEENLELIAAIPPTIVLESYTPDALSLVVPCLVYAAFHCCCRLEFIAEKEAPKFLEGCC